uniref:Murinoglobulin-2-like n=1 Tax=Fundulus heteroclitus TaxID=8078 RepID=A0A3Q2QV52_FUNHE
MCLCLAVLHQDPVVQRALGCLKDALARDFDNLYTKALMLYTFSLAGDQETRSKIMTVLDQKAEKNGTTKRKPCANGAVIEQDLEVEMTSYVLLALLVSPPLEGFGLDYTSGIVRWLAQKQNPYGGFSSTQDTVVALQALAKYADATYSPQGTTTVTVTSLGGLKKEFTVTQSNRLLYQEERLSEVPGEYTIRAEGQSCVLAQVRRRPPSAQQPTQVIPVNEDTSLGGHMGLHGTGCIILGFSGFSLSNWIDAGE